MSEAQRYEIDLSSPYEGDRAPVTLVQKAARAYANYICKTPGALVGDGFVLGDPERTKHYWAIRNQIADEEKGRG